jgi:tRNA threonylcarbamoyl adenosine modification protein YeaZ
LASIKNGQSLMVQRTMADLKLRLTHFALGIYTTGPELGLGVTDFAAPGRFAGWNLGRELSLYLHQYLQDFMPPQPWSDLQFIAVARGPGSFTSTRLGMVTARTLAQQLDIPLFAISTLAAAAWAIATRNSLCAKTSIAIAAEMPAQQGQVYGSLYQFKLDPANIPQGQLESLLPDQLLSIEQWQQTLEQQRVTYQRVNSTEFPSAPEMSAAILELAYLAWQRGDRPNWSAALPFYG